MITISYFKLELTLINLLSGMEESGAHFGGTYALDLVNEGSGVLESIRGLFLKHGS